MEKKPLPESLQKELDLLRSGIKQWSQIVAWSWTDYLAYGINTDEGEQEQKLKDFLIKILQKQALYNDAVSNYGDEKMKSAAYRASITIKKFVMGKNSEIHEMESVKLTLPKVYEKLTGKNPESLCVESFMNQFHVEIVTDKFSGYIRDISDSEKNEIQAVIKDINKNDVQYVNDVKYIIAFAYPPCPILGPATVTKKQLEDWSQNKNEYGESATDYLPPSAYIPTCMS